MQRHGLVEEYKEDTFHTKECCYCLRFVPLTLSEFHGMAEKDEQPSGWRISQKAHPNLYEVLQLFQREEAASEVTILQLEAGGTHN